MYFMLICCVYLYNNLKQIEIMQIGQKLNYFGKSVEVLEFNKTHVVIKFENGNKLCTTKTAFNR